MPTIHLLIEGRVQGVYYRVSARDAARRLGITGWVRNTGEGHVEAMATGRQEDLDSFVVWCHVGPSGAKVSKVRVGKEEEEIIFEEFTIQRG